MKKSEVVHKILAASKHASPNVTSGKIFAPTNIALCKYWGKRNQELNLPVTPSFSIGLGEKGATVEMTILSTNVDKIILNDVVLATDSGFAQRLIAFLDLFRGNENYHFEANIETNIPVAAGLASSACGFASVVLALNALLNWQLTLKQLSILARLGSGSASRSLWSGFVEWHSGMRDDGMDSYAEKYAGTWPELCVGLLLMSRAEKKISSRAAMQRTIVSSSLYSAWPDKVADDLMLIKTAINTKDFALFGQTTESNALAMHATMLAAWPPVSYCLPETLFAMQKVWQLREVGLQIFFTQDAGPNLKLLFLQADTKEVATQFPEMELLTNLV